MSEIAAKELIKTGFFDYLDFMLQFAPPVPEEKEIRARLARIGVGPGKTFDFKSLSPEQKAAVVEGMKAGEAKVEQAVAGTGNTINGWTLGGFSPSRHAMAGRVAWGSQGVRMQQVRWPPAGLAGRARSPVCDRGRDRVLGRHADRVRADAGAEARRCAASLR